MFTDLHFIIDTSKVAETLFGFAERLQKGNSPICVHIQPVLNQEMYRSTAPSSDSKPASHGL